MRWSNIALIAAAGLGLVLASPAAEAAKKKQTGIERPTRITVIDETGRARTRIIVTRRSFLDPGREVILNSQHYSDYATGPSYHVFPRSFQHTVAPGDWDRKPLPGQFDVPGYSRW
jgi:hypothetical protein